MHTDGVPETPDEKNEMIGYGNLPGLVCRCSGSTLTSALDNIMEEIKLFKEGAQLIDDIVLLGFEVGG